MVLVRVRGIRVRPDKGLETLHATCRPSLVGHRGKMIWRTVSGSTRLGRAVPWSALRQDLGLLCGPRCPFDAVEKILDSSGFLFTAASRTLVVQDSHNHLRHPMDVSATNFVVVRGERFRALSKWRKSVWLSMKRTIKTLS